MSSALNAPDLSVYLVTDEPQCARMGRSVVHTVRAAVDGGVTCVQVRLKDAPGGQFLTQVREVSRAVGHRVPVIVNDRVDVFLAARALGAPVAGVHVGQSDLPVEVVRELVGPNAWIGLSASSQAELEAAERGGSCDYVGIGAVRETMTKADAPSALGVEGVGGLAAASSLPAVAIGGIGADDLPGLRAAGVAGAAVVSAICLAEDPRGAAAQLRAAWENRAPS